jgi:DNA-binding transcriptional LysR family regulator
MFDRHTRGVDLTDAGELFLDRARVTLAAAEAARSTGRDLEAGLVGSIRLGVATCAGWRGTSALLATFARDRPDVEVPVSESYGGTLTRDLRDGRLDAVLAPPCSLRPSCPAHDGSRAVVGACRGVASPGRAGGRVTADELHAERWSSRAIAMPRPMTAPSQKRSPSSASSASSRVPARDPPSMRRLSQAMPLR